MIDPKVLKETVRILFFSFLVFYVVIVYVYVQHPAKGPHAIGNISTISDGELKNIAEELFAKSSAELYRHVTIKYQGQITPINITDNAPERLLNVTLEVFSTPTTKSLIKLFDNYELDTYREEIITDEEAAEQAEFIHNLMKTDTILHTMNSLSTKGFFENDLQVYKEVLREIWFSQYSRNKGINGSSGFEHVFLAERKPRKGIGGLHNWIFFLLNESTNKINYFGFLRNVDIDGKVAIAQVYFTFNKRQKMSSMFIGTTPELEIALYTLCFFARPNRRCKASFAGVDFNIQTHVLQNGNKKYVASAYPVI